MRADASECLGARQHCDRLSLSLSEKRAMIVPRSLAGLDRRLTVLVMVTVTATRDLDRHTSLEVES